MMSNEWDLMLSLLTTYHSSLKFFRFYQHVTEIAENQDRDNKQQGHDRLDFIKKVNGFEKDRKTDECCDD